jgi:GntR family transcriptional regulator
MIEHGDVVPLYQQLIDVLRSALVNGEIRPGEQLPSESELISQYHISSITVRKAIAVLAKEGLVVKKQGKGTFAERPKIDKKIFGPISFTTACLSDGMRPGSRLMQRLVREADALEKRELGLPEGGRILYIQRLRFADNEPLLVENNYFAYPEYEFLLNKDIDANSLYETMRRERGIKIASTHKTIEIVSAGKSEATLLEVKIGAPLFYVRGKVYDENERLVHIAAQYIRGDRFRLTV